MWDGRPRPSENGLKMAKPQASAIALVNAHELGNSVSLLHALQERHAALARQHRQRCGICDARGQVSRPERCDASLSSDDVHGMNERTIPEGEFDYVNSVRDC